MIEGWFGDEEELFFDIELVSSYAKLFIDLLNLESRFHKYFRRREYKINFAQVLTYRRK